MSRLGNLGHRLHRGEVSYDFVGKRKLWYGVSIVITLVAIIGLAVNGLNKGIEFSGGAVFTTPKTSVSTADAQTKTQGVISGHHDVIAQKLGNGGLRIQVSGIDGATAGTVKQDLAKELGVDANAISPQVVGPSWGQEISQKAELGLVIFMVLVVLYLAVAFEWRMAISALVALVHDLTITVGVYAIVGFEVTPGTVIGLLTILGYSLYDTVVVFDGLKETTKSITSQTRFTYSELANRSLNQTLVRSINTTVVALLPVAALLFVGGGLLGAGMLNDIALALFVGLAAGAYSSIFIATPLVASLKERTPEMKALAKRVRAKRAQAEAKGEEPQDAVPDAGDEDEPVEAGATASVGGQRRQPASRSRGRGRPSGKRR
ncbi:protein translocase subunit SecF [Streptantibioticus ferralitis]|uniref:Protein-export membrane protein SecF n=1 Tax=Streptantibioticus ferralitis TaxID=236510 RepID=A0ABT5Z5X6_9ACTN|nr:protein translocase subunit SecF [Streptantibioticus ferralitis]MDF2259240.1 protein translocase subunit SecF [Streptantibioticus ferralitis]